MSQKTPSERAIAEAAKNPGGWVYEIGGGLHPNGRVPLAAIAGAWQVDKAGQIVGEFQPNPNHDAKRFPIAGAAARAGWEFGRWLLPRWRAMTGPLKGLGEADMFDRAIKWIMLVSGVLTLTMFYAAIAPNHAVQTLFGETVDGATEAVIVRNWGVLIGLMGAVLIYGAFHPGARTLALLVAGASKAAFVTLVLSQGAQYLDGVGLAVAIDALCVIIFALYLLLRKYPREVPI